MNSAAPISTSSIADTPDPALDIPTSNASNDSKLGHHSSDPTQPDSEDSSELKDAGDDLDKHQQNTVRARQESIHAFPSFASPPTPTSEGGYPTRATTLSNASSDASDTSMTSQLQKTTKPPPNSWDRIARPTAPWRARRRSGGSTSGASVVSDAGSEGESTREDVSLLFVARAR